MTAIKKILCVVCSVFLMFIILSSAASAITIDGTIENVEWKMAEKFTIFPYGSSTNCDINFAVMKVLINREKDELYLAFQVTQKTADALKAGNALAGVKLCMKSGTYITCRSNSVSEYDNNVYSVDRKAVIGTNNDLNIEMRVGFKFGIPEKIMSGLQLIDGYGEPSNFYNWPVETELTSKVATTQKHETSTTSKTTVTATHHEDSTPVNEITSKIHDIAGNGQGNSQNTTLSTSGNTTPGEVQSGLNTIEQTEQSQSVAEQDAAETSSGSTGINRTKQIFAIAFAVLLIAAAVCLCVFAGLPKKNQKPDEKKEPEIDDDDF